MNLSKLNIKESRQNSNSKFYFNFPAISHADIKKLEISLLKNCNELDWNKKMWICHKNKNKLYKRSNS